METFDFTGDDIKDLRDDDLRELIGLLCEADYRSNRLRTSGITSGGNQDAPDGGFDVVVSDDFPPPINSNIPRAYTGFQVKKPAMSAAEILKEMKPKGELRKSIKELISHCGAYIIVSSTASTAFSALEDRKAAMRRAVSDAVGHENLYIDFYDRGRIATWVRSHPSLILWIRRKLGRSLQGWQAYDNWSAPHRGVKDNYLLDDGLTIHMGAQSDEKGKTALEAIGYLRQKLSQPRVFLRLVGLSGVGKTRFVQALFDERIGEKHLDQSLAIYTDLSHSPLPGPIPFANNLIAARNPAIMIVDNCPPDLHRQLVLVCTSPESRISILSIEYDVREDLPEVTDVVRLEPSSVELVRQLIERRYPHIGQVNTATIADFSGGNFRVALALAGTIEQGETVGRLRDVDLFKRLFHQTNNPSENLLHDAEALSLVYSFDGKDIDTDKSELRGIAALIERPTLEMHRSIAELQRRQLIQSRGDWRAILPHAIANRLAEQALTTIPRVRILDTFMQGGRERLLQSFSRRLGFLHDNAEAKIIASEWLAADGWFGKTAGEMKDVEFEIFKNIAPIVPGEVLSILEYWTRHTAGTPFNFKNRHSQDYVNILRRIAYESALFPRSAALICKFTLAAIEDERRNAASDRLKSLFYIYLSGTHATATQRAKIIEDLWDAAHANAENLALSLLDAAYEVWHFVSAQEFNFGARRRDYGWHPTTKTEATDWYRTFISLGLKFALSKSANAIKAKSLLANNFRGLWTKAKMYVELENVIDQLTLSGPWIQGWASVRETIKFDAKASKADSVSRLHAIEAKMKPGNLLETVRAYALSDHPVGYILTDSEDENNDSNPTTLEKFVEQLGRNVAEMPEIFAIILPDLVTIHNGRIWDLGRGLADGARDKLQLWQNIRSAYIGIPRERIRVQCLMGILSSASMESVREGIMESLVDDELLGEHFPQIQLAYAITPMELSRLYRSLELGIAPISMFQYIGWGRAHEALSDDDFVPYLRKILGKEDGIIVVLEILNMRFLRADYKYTKAMRELVRDVVLKFPYAKLNSQRRNYEHSLAELAGIFLRDIAGRATATTLCKTLLETMRTNYSYGSQFQLLLEKLAELQPMAFLDVFFSEEGERFRIGGVFGGFGHHGAPLKKISNKDILEWCAINPAKRFLAIASAISVFQTNSDDKSLEWNPLVLHIFDLAPNTSDILNDLAPNIVPNTFSGSGSDIILRRAEVLKKLFSHENDVIVSWVKAQYDLALRLADDERKWEERENKRRGETFE